MSITVMKQMVAEMEYVLSCINENKVPFDGDDFHEALRLGRQAIASAQEHVEAEKQEPVAWIDIDEKGAASGLRYWSEPENRHEVALYTSPPQRQPLTDEEIRSIWSDGDCFEEIAFARAIEAAHDITASEAEDSAKGKA